MRILFGAGLLFSAAAIAFSQSSDAPPQGMRERTGMRNERYCEILVVNRQLMSAKATVYNTIGLNECPEDLWAKINANSLAKQLHATAVILNGPRHFMMDRNAAAATEVGAEKYFNGLAMRPMATVEIKSLSKRVPYTDTIVDRDTQYVYEEGKYVYELVSPNHKTYIMQSYSTEVDHALNEQDLVNLGNKLKLPKGWKFSARKLDKTFVLRTDGNKAAVLQDDLRDSYQRID